MIFPVPYRVEVLLLGGFTGSLEEQEFGSVEPDAVCSLVEGGFGFMGELDVGQQLDSLAIGCDGRLVPEDDQMAFELLK